MSVQYMAGILKGLTASEDRLQKIHAASDQNRRANETFELDKKIKNLKIDQLEQMGQLDAAAVELERKRIKEQSDLYDAQSAVNESSIEDAMTQTKDMQDHFLTEGQKVAGSLMHREYVPFKGFRTVTTKSPSDSVKPADKVLGALDSGGVYNPQNGLLQEFGTQANAEAYAAQNLGTEWKNKYPAAKDKIDLNYGGINILPSDVMSDTQYILPYLQKKYGLDRTAAAQWIRKNIDPSKIKR